MRFLPTCRSVCIAFGTGPGADTNQEVEMHDAKVIEELEALRLPELQARYAEVTGEETRSPNKKYLSGTIVDRMAVAELVERHAAAEGTDAELATEEIAEAGTPPETDRGDRGDRRRRPEIADHPAETEADPRSPPRPPETPADPRARTRTEAPAEPAPEKKPRRKKADQTDGDTDAGEPKVSKMDVARPAGEVQGADRPRESSSLEPPVPDLAVPAGRRRAGSRPGRGPAARGGEKVDVKVLPMRVPTAAIDPLDEVWRKLGLRSRNEMFRAAMAAFLSTPGRATSPPTSGRPSATTTPTRSSAPRHHAAGLGFVPEARGGASRRRPLPDPATRPTVRP